MPLTALTYLPIMAFILKTFLAGIWWKTLPSSSVLPHSAHCQQGYSNPSGIILWARRPSSRSQAYCQQAFPSSGRKMVAEKLWRGFFSDPSQWWDNRLEKVNERHPDFKHKKTQAALWLDNNSTPPWVKTELAEMAPGTLQFDIFPWNKRLERYVQTGHCEGAMKLFEQIQQHGMETDTFTFVPILHACSKLQSLEHGKHIHRQIIKAGHDSDAYVCSCLVDMYAKCGSIEDARRVFDKMSTRNVVAWSSMLVGYVKCGQGHEALALARQMQREGVDPNPVTFVGMLNACASLGSLEEGRRIHTHIIERDYESDIFVGSGLIDMYGKCGSIGDAQQVFNKMPTRNVVAWNAMLMGYVKCGEVQEALELSRLMQRDGVDPSPVTFVVLLKACASLVALEEGRRIHEQIVERGYESDANVGNCLVDMYAKCGSIGDARRVFNKMSARDVGAWNAMLMGYVKCGEGQEALELSEQMQKQGTDPDPFTFVGLLNACASLANLEEGRRVHEQILGRGFDSDIFVGSSLVDMYAKCGSIVDAWQVFSRMPERNVVAWGAMIVGYVKCGEGEKALELSRQMQRERVEPDLVTFVGLLNACASVAALEEGRHVHEQIVERGYELDVYIGNCLIDMYAKCGSIEDARQVFNKMPVRDVVGWNAMLAGYGTHGYAREALEHFKQMGEVVEVDRVTFTCLLSTCSHGGLVDEGLCYFESMSAIHCISPTVEHYACIIDLLGRVGRLHEAEDLIRTMECEPIACVWMSLLAACRIHRNVDLGECIAKPALELYPENAGGYVLLSNIYTASA